MSEGFGYPRPMEYQSTQFRAANFVIDSESETELLKPPSIDRETILNLSLKEVKEQYPRRYEMYVKLVRELKHPESENDPVNLTEKDVEDMKKWLLALNSVDNYIARHRSPKEGDEITLRGERQVDVFDDMRKFLERNEKSGYLKLPTGFGKTVLFTELVEAINLRTLIVVPTKLLIHQTVEKFKDFAPGVEVGKVYGDEKDFGKFATVITYDSLIVGLKNGDVDPKDYDMLILDEAHVITGEGRKEAVAQFSDAVKLGFTATPVYKPGEKEVSDVLGTEIHKLNIREAVEGSYLSSFSTITVKTEIDITDLTNKEEFNEDDLEKRLNVPKRNLAAVKLYKEAFNGRLAVAYCINKKHAEKLTELFNSNGVSAAFISGDTPDKEQERILADYKSGEIKVLCNADLLVAGFDEQQASVCLNLRPTKSLVVAEQRGGRVLRIDDKNPNKHAYIVEFLDKGAENSGQVLFPQVADAVELESKEKKEQVGGGSGGRVDFSDIDLEGLEIIMETEVVLEIVSKLKKPEKVELYKDIKLLKAAIKASGIKPNPKRLFESYKEAVKNNPTWPSAATVIQIEGFTSFEDLWGVEKIITDYDRIKAAIKASGIKPDPKKLMESYDKARKTNPTWPSYGYVMKMDGYISTQDLWGIEKIKDYTKLKAAIKASGIKPDPKKLVENYKEAVKINRTWPSVTTVINMEDFVSMEDLWGIEIIKDYIKLKLVIRASGISPDKRDFKGSYERARKTNPTWPGSDLVKKMEGFISFEDLWGFELITDYAVLKNIIAASGVVPDRRKLVESYEEARKSDPSRSNWPSSGFVVNMKGFISFEDLWGVVKKLSFVELKNSVQTLIKSSDFPLDSKDFHFIYTELRKRYPHLPSASTVRNMNGFISFRDIIISK